MAMNSHGDCVKPAREQLRFLKLLQKDGSGLKVMAKSESVFQLALGGRHFKFPAAMVKQCLRHQLVCLDADNLRLSEAGLSCLKRLLHPDLPYLAQHTDVHTRQTLEADAPVTVNSGESPLGRLFVRRDGNGRAWLSESEFRAGERLRQDFERAGLQPRITANWEASVASSARGSSAGEISDFAIDARRRLEAAMHAIGPELSGAVVDICCFLKGLETVERERSWPARSAKLMLRTALRLLVRHYGLETRVRSGPITQWGTADYRPVTG
jgi:hypothetical protein